MHDLPETMHDAINSTYAALYDCLMACCFMEHWHAKMQHFCHELHDMSSIQDVEYYIVTAIYVSDDSQFILPRDLRVQSPPVSRERLGIWETVKGKP